MSDFTIKSNPYKVGMPPVGAVAAISREPAVLTGLAEFNQSAGVPHPLKGHHVTKVLGQRLGAVPRRTTRTSTRKAPNLPVHGEDPHLESAVAEAVEALRQIGKSAFEAQLSAQYDVLERHTLLRNARSRIDEKDISQSEKDDLKNKLNEIMSDLMDEHGDVIRAGLQDARAFETALGTMDALATASGQNQDANALGELRAVYGAKGNGKLETPFTPLALARSLQNRFGAENFSQALADLRSKLAADLRSHSATHTGPRLWLSLADAACFRAVQSSFAIAGDLRRALSERAGIVPRATQAATAAALLEVTESSTGKTDALVAQIVKHDELEALQQALLYLLLRQAVGKLATTMWTEERLAQRLDLLEELSTLTSDAYGKLPASRSPDREREQQLRQRVGRRKSQEQDGGSDEAGDDGHEGTEAEE